MLIAKAGGNSQTGKTNWFHLATLAPEPNLPMSVVITLKSTAKTRGKAHCAKVVKEEPNNSRRVDRE